MELPGSTDFTLTAPEKQSPVWLRLTGHFEAELHRLRMQNDHPLPDAERNQLIGEIRCLKRLLGLGTVEDPIKAAEPAFRM